jgi:tryptophanyl-tRNA synthetase
MTASKRILSGMRPTGRLHLGNLHGALGNWIEMQDRYDCFFFIADWHALTTGYEETGSIRDNAREVMIDWLAAGLSPERNTLFVQSHIKEHAELFLLLSMITPVPWLERNPTYKDQMAQLSGKDLSTFGFLGYPVLQAADIIIYKADGVPVGVDQVPHVEITREIARRFNHLYGRVFPEPDAILAKTSKVLGWDRRKMSKSYDNAIYLSDDPEVAMEKVSRFITDPDRKRRADPGNPDICNVFDYHKLYSSPALVHEIGAQCRAAGIGCVECKRKMGENLLAFLAPIRERRVHFEGNPDRVAEIAAAGGDKARGIARRTLEEVRAAVRI